MAGPYYRSSAAIKTRSALRPRSKRDRCTSCSIGEPLTLEAFQGNFGAAHVVNAQTGAGVLTEIKFGNITV